MEKLRVAAIGDFSAGPQKYVRVNGKQMYVTRVGAAYFTAECNCPCPLSGGILNRIVEHHGAPCVECDARCYTLAFDLSTGVNTRGEEEAIVACPTHVENGEIFVTSRGDGAPSPTHRAS